MLKLPPISFQKPTTEGDTAGLIRWADQVMNYLREIQLSVDSDVEDANVGYIQLPLWQMYETGATDLTATPPTFADEPTPLVSAAQSEVGYPALYFLATFGPVGSWVASRWLQAAETSVWHTIFQLPGDYVSYSDLILTFNEACIMDTDATNPPTVHSICVYARRDTNANGKGVYGYNAGTWAIPGDFTWNANICLTSVQDTTPEEEWTQAMGTAMTFTIDGDNGSYPLTPGRFILLSFESKTTAASAHDIRNIFSNFYVKYERN